MQIGSAFGASNIFDLSEISREENHRKFSGLAAQATPSGDTVDISDEARRLYSEMIHKYDKPGSSTPQTEKIPVVGEDNKEEVSENAEGAGGAPASGASSAGGGSSSSSADEVEKIKKQIESLKSQLMALASQAGAEGENSAAKSKMNALQSQIAALTAQLNAMQQAG